MHIPGRKWQRWTAATIIAVSASTGLAACSSSSSPASTVENDASQRIWSHYNQVQPLYEPTGLSEYRSVAAYVQATHVLGLNTYTFFLRKGGNGGPMFECPSLGSALPNTAEPSNPNFISPDPNNTYNTQNPGSVITGNMNPDGVYAPSASQGTDVECLSPSGKKFLAYAEDDIVQLNVGSAKWDPSLYGGQGGIVITGNPVMPVCQVRTTTRTVPDPTASSGSGDTVKQTVSATRCSRPK